MLRPGLCGVTATARTGRPRGGSCFVGCGPSSAPARDGATDTLTIGKVPFIISGSTRSDRERVMNALTNVMSTSRGRSMLTALEARKANGTVSPFRVYATHRGTSASDVTVHGVDIGCSIEKLDMAGMVA
jgi:hypothetical protein